MLLIFSFPESNASPASESATPERMSEPEMYGHNNEVRSDAAEISKCPIYFFLFQRYLIQMSLCLIDLDGALLDGNSTPIGVRSSSDSEFGILSASAITAAPDALQKEEERPRATTRDIQMNSRQRQFDCRRYIISLLNFLDPREWSADAVLRWFQSHKLDEYVIN